MDENSILMDFITVAKVTKKTLISTEFKYYSKSESRLKRAA